MPYGSEGHFSTLYVIRKVSPPPPCIFPIHTIPTNIKPLPYPSSITPPPPLIGVGPMMMTIVIIGIPSYTEDEVREFARHLSENVAPQLLGPVRNILNLLP